MKSKDEIKNIIRGDLKQSEQVNSQSIIEMLSRYKGQIANALPKHLTPDRMIQIATTVIARNDKIKNCSPASIIGAVVQASILGFKPIETLGECYFVPYKGQCQFQIGYRGYKKLAHNTNKIKMLYAEVVYQDDKFYYELGLNPKLEHVPNLNADNSWNKITHVYAVAHYTNGGYSFVVLDRKKIENFRRRNPMQGPVPSGAWETDYDSMARAKAIKQLAKWMPLSEELEIAITQDEKIIPIDEPEAILQGTAGYYPDEYNVVEEESGQEIKGEVKKDENISQFIKDIQGEQNDMFNLKGG